MEIREVLKTALVVMDESGWSDGDKSMLWNKDWECLRELLLTALMVVDDPDLVVAIEQNIDVVEGNLTGVKIDFL